MTDDATLMEALAVELLPLSTMEVVFEPTTVLQFVGIFQLVLRHPQLPNAARETAERFIAGAREYFAECPTVLYFIDLGDDPTQDR